MSISKPQKLIRLSKSCIGVSEKQAVMAVLDREYLGMGDEVRQFEEALSTYFERPAICVTNGTSAIHLAVQACGIGTGDEVLIPSLTYVASFQAVSATGAKPVACDIDPVSLTIDCNDAESRITNRTRAVMPVHYAGGVGDLDAVYDFAERHQLRVVEDAAHAFGTRHKGRLVGSYGDVSCFSFDGIKNITSGEGGCIVTGDQQIQRLIQDARLLGVQKDTEKRYNGQRSWDFDVTVQGWRSHMSNIMAAIGIEQLKRFETRLFRRQTLARLYDEHFAYHPRITPLNLDYNNVVPHIYVVRISELDDRKNLQATLLDLNIQTGVHYYPNHWLSYFKDSTARPLPVVEKVYPELLTLPLHPDLSEDEVNWVAQCLKNELRLES